FYRKRHSSNEIQEMVDTNISFPIKIIDAMSRNNVRYFINTGTFTEFGIVSEGLNERGKISPSNLYSATKVAFEDVLKYYCNNYNIHAVTLKLLSPYGPRDNPNKLIPYLINCSLSNKVAETSPGEQRWDYVYVKDVARAYRLALEYIINSGISYDFFVIGGGEAHTIREIAEIIRGFDGTLKVNWGSIPYSEKETYYVRADITKARNILKWWPKYDLRKGLLETYEYYKEEQSEQ
ncbi:MAG: NAD(P)-dependent oxidoreductase, partial [Thermoplasmatales archaeon]